MQTVILHIGFGKTGTSAIQKMFATNKLYLKKSGVLYPQTGLLEEAHQLLGNSNNNKFNKKAQKLYLNLTKEIQSSQCKTIIISSESFCFCKPQFIQKISEFLKTFDVKIVFYIRNQLKLIESTFLQWVKGGHDYQGNIENFFNLHQNSFDFVQRIEPWVVNFGEKSIIARLFHKQIIGNDVCADFNKLLHLDSLLKDYTSQKVNPSLLNDFVPLIRIIDELQTNTGQRNKIMNELIQLSQKFKSCSSLSLIDESLADRIKNKFQQSNLEFANRFLSQEEKKLLIG